MPGGMGKQNEERIIHGNQGNGTTDEPACRAGMETQMQRMTYGHSGGKGGWNELEEWH